MPIRADFRQSSDLVAASSGRSLITAPCRRCKSIVADSQLVFGAGRGGNRSTYKIWEEGKPPDFVLEVASPSPQTEPLLQCVGCDRRRLNRNRIRSWDRQVLRGVVFAVGRKPLRTLES